MGQPEARGAQVIGKVQIRNTKEGFRSVSGVPAFVDPRAGRAELAAQKNGARSKAH